METPLNCMIYTFLLFSLRVPHVLSLKVKKKRKKGIIKEREKIPCYLSVSRISFSKRHNEISRFGSYYLMAARENVSRKS